MSFLRFLLRSRRRPAWIYFISDGDRVKIGYTARNPHRRLKQLQTGSSRRLYLLAAMPGTMADERALHERFASLRVSGEWFAIEPALLQEKLQRDLQPASALPQPLGVQLRQLWPDLCADLADLRREYGDAVLAGLGLFGLIAIGLIAQALER
jgi:hypothetical protein